MKKKIFKLIAFTIAFTYLFCGSGVYAQSVASSSQPASSAAQPAASPSQPGAPDVTAQTGIVADADTGYVYYQKNMHMRMYPASITKILTGLLAVENGNNADEITVTEDVYKGMTSGVARIYLDSGEKITQEEALYTMFLASANDSANALALHIGGTMDNFVKMMNARAKKLGAVDSHFSNANGLPDTNNVSSAYDMALITKKALEEPALMKYFGATSYTMPTTNMRDKTVAYQTLHKMMKNTVYQYDGVIAGKTGWEIMSGHTLVTAAKRNGRTLICVVMKSSSAYTVYTDTKALLDYGFAQTPDNASADYLKAPVVLSASSTSSTKPAAAVTPSKQIQTSVSSPNNMTAPLLLLACAVCLFGFLASCRKNSKKSRRSVRRRSNGSSIFIERDLRSPERRRSKA